MPGEEKILETQIELLERAIIILESRAREIEKNEKGRTCSSSAESEMKAVIGAFKVRSIILCKDTLSYVAKEITRKEPKIGYFLLPHVRTVLDVYARFVHLLENCSNESEQAMTCIAYQLLLTKYLNSETEYLKCLDINKNFLNQAPTHFPLTLSGYGKTWVKNNKLAFARMDTLLTPENMKKYALEADAVFGTDRTYEIYSALSEYLHGNPNYYVNSPHNEKFWVISLSTSVLAFFIEVIDLYTLQKRGARDFRIWLNDVKKNKPDFAKLWYERRIHQ